LDFLNAAVLLLWRLNEVPFLDCCLWTTCTLSVYYLKLVQVMELKGACLCRDHSLLKRQNKIVVQVRKSQVYIFGEKCLSYLTAEIPFSF